MAAANKGFNWYDLYRMPTKYRLFYYRQMLDVVEKENKPIEEAKTQSPNSRVRIRK
jgi:predicted solute-binding protein